MNKERIFEDRIISTRILARAIYDLAHTGGQIERVQEELDLVLLAYADRIKESIERSSADQEAWDRFAAAFIDGGLVNSMRPSSTIAYEAGCLADAMMAERKKRQGEDEETAGIKMRIEKTRKERTLVVRLPKYIRYIRVESAIPTEQELAQEQEHQDETAALKARIAELERTLSWHNSEEYRIHLDGDQYCATGKGFKDLQESEAAFASGPVVALAKLREMEQER